MRDTTRHHLHQRLRTAARGPWPATVALAIAEPVSWGVLYYAFSVFIEPMQAELGWSRSQITAMFSLALLVSGLAAMPFGWWLDRHGPRGLMTAGACLATVLVFAWARVGSYPVFLVIGVGLGMCMAATFYEPAFAAIAVWFPTGRARAMTLLTFGGGLASVIFIPLSAWLIERFGWRDALTVLASILGVVTIPLHALLRAPRRQGAPPARPTGISRRKALRSMAFRLVTFAFSLAMFVNVAVMVLLIPILVARGHSLAFAATAAAAVGLVALPGRLLLTPLGDWLPPVAVPAAIFLVQAAGLVILATTTATAAIWISVALFGLGFGAISPARALLVADLFGVATFASISGVMAMVLTIWRAAAPAGSSWIWARAGSDAVLLLALAAMSMGAAAVIIVSARHRPG